MRFESVHPPRDELDHIDMTETIDYRTKQNSTFGAPLLRMKHVAPYLPCSSTRARANEWGIDGHSLT